MAKISRPASAWLTVISAYICAIFDFLTSSSVGVTDPIFYLVPIVALMAIIQFAECLYRKEGIFLSILGILSLVPLALYIAFGWALVHLFV